METSNKKDIKVKRLLELIENANELIASAQRIDNPLMVKQYLFMKKELVEELEPLIGEYEIQLYIDKAA